MTAPVLPCRDPRRDPDDWFASLDVDRGRPSAAATAIKLCRGCPIQRDCLEVAMTAEGGTPVSNRFGIFGGMSPAQRLGLHRKRIAASRARMELAAAVEVPDGTGDPPGQDVAA